MFYPRWQKEAGREQLFTSYTEGICAVLRSETGGTPLCYTYLQKTISVCQCPVADVAPPWSLTVYF